MKHLQDIEDQLSKLVVADKKTWVSFYQLLKEVEQEELYREIGLNSFTAWVKNFARTNKIHESVIWARKKAGKVYETYEKRQAEMGITVAKIEELDVSADSLVLLDKISNKSPQLAEQLVEKVLNNELSREDLRQTYRTLRDAGKEHDKKSASSKINVELDDESSDTKSSELSKLNEDDNINDAEMTTMLTTSLIDNIDWLKTFGAENDVVSTEIRFKVGQFNKFKHKAFLEFPVSTGSSRKSRRIDVMLCENYYSEIGTVNLHGIEVKVSAADLKRDQKYSEYAEYVDYAWLAITSELIELALDITPDFVGIITYKQESENNTDRVIEIYRNAEKLKSLMKQEALTTALLKSI